MREYRESLTLKRLKDGRWMAKCRGVPEMDFTAPTAAEALQALGAMVDHIAKAKDQFFAETEGTQNDRILFNPTGEKEPKIL